MTEIFLVYVNYQMWSNLLFKIWENRLKGLTSFIETFYERWLEEWTLTVEKRDVNRNSRFQLSENQWGLFHNEMVLIIVNILRCAICTDLL